MHKATIDIDSDNDFEVRGPGICQTATTENGRYHVEGETEEELRTNLILFLAKLEIRRPWAKEYYPYFENSHISEFKQTIFEAIHQIAKGEPIDFYMGGNRTLSISHIKTKEP